MKITKSSTIDFKDNHILDNDIKETQNLKKDILTLQKDTRNINAQIREAKINGNNKKQNLLFQQKICIQNEINIKVKKLEKLLIPNDSFNNYSLKPKKINNLVSKLGVGALLATAFTVAANPAQAGTLTTVNFDEVNVGLEAEDNPLYGGQKINNLWQKDYGLSMSSSVNELWLYDSDCEGKSCTGGDPDLATGKGRNGNIKYDSPEQGNVLIIQEHEKDLHNSIKGLDKEITRLNNQINNLNQTIPNISNKNKRNNKINQRKKKQEQLNNKIQKRDNKIQEYIDDGNTLRPDDNIGGTITFDFTDNAGVLFDSINLLDFDEANDPIFSAVFADGTSTNNFTYNSAFFNEKKGGDENINTKQDNFFKVKWDKKYETYIKKMTVESTNWEGTEYVEGDNSLREYKFDFGEKKVTQFKIKLPGSGAITGLSYYREETKKFAKKVPEPTSLLGLATISALAASSLKRKRKSSNI